MTDDTLGLIIKVVLSLTLWALCARMVYQNELDRPENERFADLQMVKFLAVIWPVWLLGLLLSIVGVLAVKLVRLPFKLRKVPRT